VTTQAEKINNLDKQVAVISERIRIIETNHLKHIEADIASIKRVLWSVGFLLFTQLIIVIKDILF
jgi:hypothetical protein